MQKKDQSNMITITVYHQMDEEGSVWIVSDSSGTFDDYETEMPELASEEADNWHDFFISQDAETTVTISYK